MKSPSERVLRLDAAYLSPFERGKVPAIARGLRWIRGAVHDHDGELVRASQRVWGRDPESPVPADPDRLTPRKGAPRLDGTWLYAGHWMTHFGHFLLETLTNLWPEVEVDGILTHRSFRGADPTPGQGMKVATPRPWQADFLDLSGYGGLPIRVVHTRPVHVQHLLVPRRPVVFKHSVGADAVALWERMADAAGTPGGSRRVFFSRTLFHQAQDMSARQRTSPEWDHALDEAFATAGFEIVHPEALPTREQVRVARGADVLAGPSGSALHLSAFLASGRRVVEVGDARYSDQGGQTQRSIDAARGHGTDFVPYSEPGSVAAAVAALDL